MRYLPLTPEDRKKILDLCGAASFEKLTEQIPASLRVKGLLDLEPALAEADLVEHIKSFADNIAAAKMTSFLGQGVYDHTWPAVIDQLSNRGEFLTAYTPYQPEISQGTLQAIFEFQSMIASLMGMDVANASLYDGPTAAVEGVLMAARLQGKANGVLWVSEGTMAECREVLKSYLEPLGFEIRIWRADEKTFRSHAQGMDNNAGQAVGVFVQSPNKWGVVEDWSEAVQLAQKLQTKSIACVSHAMSLGTYQSPGEAGIDIAAGEGQTLGIPVGFGGPHLGLFACRQSDVRQMPGRLIGLTEDARGDRAFCVTLSTREQHIRREKATSNICSNQSLMALRAAMFLNLMGPQGLERISDLCFEKVETFKNLFAKKIQKNFPEVLLSPGEHFNEISIMVPQKHRLWLEEGVARAEDKGLIAGHWVKAPENSLLAGGLAIAFTERHKTSDIELLVNCLLGET